MDKRPRLDTSKLEKPVRRETGEFDQESLLPLIPDDELDEMAQDPSYQEHHGKVNDTRDTIALVSSDAPSPEELCQMHRDHENGDGEDND